MIFFHNIYLPFIIIYFDIDQIPTFQHYASLLSIMDRNTRAYGVVLILNVTFNVYQFNS